MPCGASDAEPRVALEAMKAAERESGAATQAMGRAFFVPVCRPIRVKGAALASKRDAHPWFLEAAPVAVVALDT